MGRTRGKKRVNTNMRKRGMPKRGMPKKSMRGNPMSKKPMRKKTTKKGKNTPNPWIQHVNAVLKEMRKTNPGASLKDAINEAKKTYKKAPSADSWNVSSSKYSTVGKDSWNVNSSKYSTVTKKSKKAKKPKKSGGGTCGGLPGPSLTN